MNLLLHICCAPCAIACIESLRSEGIAPNGFWYNPNIHPVTEYRMRRDALDAYAKSISLPLVVDDTYGLRAFCTEIGSDYSNRCEKCYRMRFEKTAEYASLHGYTAFSSTLFISPYQQHEFMIALATQAAAKFNIEFLYRDWRPFFSTGQDTARANALYMQKYCGCIFSEEERYRAKQMSREKLK